LDIPVIYINVPKVKERDIKTREVLQNLGFKKIYRVDAIDPTEKTEHKSLTYNTKALISLSKTCKTILQNFKPPFIVMEDDIDIYEFQKTISVPDNIDALYLGLSKWGSRGLTLYEETGLDNLVRVFDMKNAHAILYLTQEYVDFVLRGLDFSIYYEHHDDVVFAIGQIFFNIFATKVPMFTQYSHENQENFFLFEENRLRDKEQLKVKLDDNYWNWKKNNV